MANVELTTTRSITPDSVPRLQPTTRIYLARHCQTLYNLENRVQGSIDVPLSDYGRAEAEANASQLEPLGIDRIVCSHLKRAYQTARIYALRLGVPLYISPRFRELDLGSWEEKTENELWHDPTGLYKQWLEDPASVAIPGSSESITEAQRRIVEAISMVALRYPDEKILVVTHKFIRAILQWALLDEDLT